MVNIWVAMNLVLSIFASWGMFMSSTITFYYLRAMYFFQKFEFKRHGLKAFFTGLVIIVAFFNLVVLGAINIYAFQC